MIVVIKTLMNLLSYFKICIGSFLSGRDLVPQSYFWWLLPGAMINWWACHNLLWRYNNLWCRLGTNHNPGLKFLGLRTTWDHNYLSGPKPPESHYAAPRNIFMYFYMCITLYAVSALWELLNEFFLQVVWFCPFIKYLHLIWTCLGHLKGITLMLLTVLRSYSKSWSVSCSFKSICNSHLHLTTFVFNLRYLCSSLWCKHWMGDGERCC